MKDDPIVEEIRRVRSAHAARYGNDLDRIFAALNFVPPAYFSVQSQTAWHFAVAVFIPEITAIRL